jgi:hypothetical protein
VTQAVLPFRTPAGFAAIDAWIDYLLGGPRPILSAAQLAELEIAGDLEAMDQLELEVFPPIDWADPDAHNDGAGDLETLRWYDETADPYARGPEPTEACEFLLGTHRPHWLYPEGSREARPAGPLFVSIRQIRHARKSWPRLPWPRCDTAFSVDSGGFTEIRQNGGWATSPEQYAGEVLALRSSGTLDWAAIQDWMVEDDALAATGLSVAEHQARTVQSFLDLRMLAPDIRWLPVLQGQTLADYLAHLELYRAAGVHLETMARVGVGSVCRREGSGEIAAILAALAARGLRLHGFGVKTGGLERAATYLASSDSLAWSLGARRRLDPGARNSMAVAEEYRAAMLAIAGVR